MKLLKIFNKKKSKTETLKEALSQAIDLYVNEHNYPDEVENRKRIKEWKNLIRK